MPITCAWNSIISFTMSSYYHNECHIEVWCPSFLNLYFSHLKMFVIIVVIINRFILYQHRQHEKLICYLQTNAEQYRINNGIAEPRHKDQNCNTSQLLIFGRYLKVRGSLCTRVIVWVNTIPNNINTRTILHRHECSCMVYRPE